MYGVIEIKKGSKIINHFVDSLNEFKNELQIKYPNAKYHDNLSTADIKTNNIFIEGNYILCNQNFFQYIEKFAKVNKGYVYNQDSVDIIVIQEWEVVRFSDEILSKYDFNCTELSDNIDDILEIGQTENFSDSEEKIIDESIDNNNFSNKFNKLTLSSCSNNSNNF
jgi:hypothetical protein